MARNRHNIGFMALDTIAIRHGSSGRRSASLTGCARATSRAKRSLALKPQTYMNASGESVQSAVAFYKLPIDVITAFHDELDLVPGKVRGEPCAAARPAITGCAAAAVGLAGLLAGGWASTSRR